MAAQFTADILRILGQANRTIKVGSDSVASGNITPPEIESFEEDAKLWAANQLGIIALSTAQTTALRNAIVWKAVDLILNSPVEADQTSWMDRAQAEIDMYKELNPDEIGGASPKSGRVIGDEVSTREEPFPRSAKDLFIDSYLITRN